MKTLCFNKIQVTFVIFILTFVLFSCKKEKVNNAGSDKGNVTFSLQNTKSTTLKSTKTYSIDSITAAVVSIKDENDNYVYSNTVVKLQKLNGEFISNSLALSPGTYKLSGFMLIDKNDSVLFITPVSGSKYAYLVSVPLEISFTITKDATTNLTPEVISTENATPADFGYVTFSFSYIKTFDLLISTFLSNGISNNLGKTYLTITQSGVTVYQDSLDAKTNDIKIPEIAGDYLLYITKNGYTGYSDTISLDSLKTHASPDHTPLIITLYSTNGLVLWNKLGSSDEITHSEVGPNLYFYDPSIDGVTGYGDIIAQTAYSTGIFGNAVTIGPSSAYYSTARVHHLILRDVSSVLNYKEGCIEFWYYQTEDPLAYSHGIYRLWDGGFGFDPGISFYTSDPSETGVLFNFLIDLNSSSQISLTYSPGASIRNNHNLNNRWIHLAVVWNINGIDASGNTMRIYIDGTIVASGQDTWDNKIGNRVDICGGCDKNIANKFYMDNLKVWNYSKTDFSDRYTENAGL
jgi:hypothetical protein